MAELFLKTQTQGRSVRLLTIVFVCIFLSNIYIALENQLPSLVFWLLDENFLLTLQPFNSVEQYKGGVDIK